MNITKIDKNECVGCMACIDVCPTRCIIKDINGKGFLIPKVNDLNCIHCGKCMTVCPTIEKKQVTTNEDKIFRAFNLNSEVVEKSSSGGIFYSIAEYVLINGGVVYGAAFDENQMVSHSRCDSIEKIEEVMRSKYVQSDMTGIYAQIKKDLQSSLMVLFVGTPCQVVAIKKYLSVDYANFICIDFICHGVPSPGVWGKYLSGMEKKNKSKIKSVNFRDKSSGWENYSFEIKFFNGKKFKQVHQKNTYMLAFLLNLILRPSCYTCQYKKSMRRSDITLADYWGTEKESGKDNIRGTSLAFINSKSGEKIFNKVAMDKLCFSEISYSRAIKDNQSAESACEKHKRTDKFWHDYQDTNDVENLIKKCLLGNFFLRMIKKIKRIINHE